MPSRRQAQACTQFGRVCAGLGIEVITTSSAEAKGRVERCFRTFQDRLVNEMRLNGITTVKAANQFLEGFIKRHNERFALSNDDVQNAFRSLDGNTRSKLNSILCVIEQRSILNGNVVSFNNEQFMPIEDNGEVLLLAVDTKIDVVRTLNDQLLARYQDRDYRLIKVADGRFTAHTPQSTHPWKRYNPNWLG